MKLDPATLRAWAAFYALAAKSPKVAEIFNALYEAHYPREINR